MKSMVVIFPYPSGIFEGIETTDLLICEVRAYLSSFGNFAVILYKTMCLLIIGS